MSVRGLIAFAAAVALLAGCASIPEDGPIREGTLEIEPAEPFFIVADGPSPTDGPTAIVRGFLLAAAAGVTSDFSVAREFLTVRASRDWNPNARVMVFDSGALTPVYDSEAGRVSYDVPIAAYLDESGRMVQGIEDDRETLEFVVNENELGRWRIAGLEDGILISEANFNSYFRPVELYFASKDGTTLVPELRWLPNNNIATAAARELVAGPSPWLADAVDTGFAPGASLESDSVVVTDGVAAVRLASPFAGTPAQRSLAQEQLRLTLTALPTVSDVTVTVGGLPIGGDGSATLLRPPAPNTNAPVMVGDQLGVWDGSDMWVTTPDEGRLPDGAADLAQAFGVEPQVAFLIGGSTVAVSDVIANGPAAMAVYDEGADVPSSVMNHQTVHEGSSLAGLAYDRHQWLWTAEDAGGEVVAIDPSGTAVVFEVRGLAERTVQAVTMSRDGTRLAVVSRIGSQQWVEVLPVVRAADGSPVSLGSPVPIGVDLDVAVDATWVDENTVAVLEDRDDEVPPRVWIITVGGRTEVIDAVLGATAVASRYGELSLTVVTRDGSVNERSGTGWSSVVAGVREFTYAG